VSLPGPRRWRGAQPGRVRPATLQRTGSRSDGCALHCTVWTAASGSRLPCLRRTRSRPSPARYPAASAEAGGGPPAERRSGRCLSPRGTTWFSCSGSRSPPRWRPPPDGTGNRPARLRDFERTCWWAWRRHSTRESVRSRWDRLSRITCAGTRFASSRRWRSGWDFWGAARFRRSRQRARRRAHDGCFDLGHCGHRHRHRDRPLPARRRGDAAPDPGSAYVRAVRALAVYDLRRARARRAEQGATEPRRCGREDRVASIG